MNYEENALKYFVDKKYTHIPNYSHFIQELHMRRPCFDKSKMNSMDMNSGNAETFELYAICLKNTDRVCKCILEEK